MKEKKDCAFQYWNGNKMASDESGLTLNEAKELWNEYYDDMVARVEDGKTIEVCIWVNMASEVDYDDKLVHLHGPEVKNGRLYEPTFYGKYQLNQLP